MVTSINLINILNNKGELGGLGSTFIVIRAYYVDTTPRFFENHSHYIWKQKNPPMVGKAFSPTIEGERNNPHNIGGGLYAKSVPNPSKKIPKNFLFFFLANTDT